MSCVEPGPFVPLSLRVLSLEGRCVVIHLPLEMIATPPPGLVVMVARAYRSLQIYNILLLSPVASLWAK